MLILHYFAINWLLVQHTLFYCKIHVTQCNKPRYLKTHLFESVMNNSKQLRKFAYLWVCVCVFKLHVWMRWRRFMIVLNNVYMHVLSVCMCVHTCMRECVFVSILTDQAKFTSLWRIKEKFYIIIKLTLRVVVKSTPPECALKKTLSSHLSLSWYQMCLYGLSLGSS